MKQITILIAASLLLLGACKKDTVRKIDSTYHPDVSPSKFKSSTNVTNPYSPFTAGNKYIYEGQTTEWFGADRRAKIDYN